MVGTRDLLDALRVPAVVLDEAGLVIETNGAWDEFEGFRGIAPPGSDYLAAADSTVVSTQVVGTGLRDLLSGASSSFSAVYPCPSPTEPVRYFRMRAVGIRGGCLIVHVPVSRRGLVTGPPDLDLPPDIVVAINDGIARPLLEIAEVATDPALLRVIDEARSLLARVGAGIDAGIGRWRLRQALADLRSATVSVTHRIDQAANPLIDEVSDLLARALARAGPSLAGEVGVSVHDRGPVVSALITTDAPNGDLEAALRDELGSSPNMNLFGDDFESRPALAMLFEPRVS